MKQPSQAQSRRGFTLLELIVVLSILAALATVAVQSVSHTADQARFEATQKTIDNLRTACLGSGNAALGNDSVRGFVADMGRMPTHPNELLANINSVAPFSVQEVETGVLVPRGWRGPYLQLPLGSSAISDGWGRTLLSSLDPSASAFIFTTRQTNYIYATPAVNTSTQELESVLNLGADGVFTLPTVTTDYNVDLNSNFVAPTVSYHGGMVTGLVYKLDSSTSQRVAPTKKSSMNVDLMPTKIEVALFSPAPIAELDNTGHGVWKQIKTILPADASSGEWRFTFTSPTMTGLTIDSPTLTIGPRVLRATVTFTDDDNSSTVSTVQSAPAYLVIQPGQTHLVDLRVQ